MPWRITEEGSEGPQRSLKEASGNFQRRQSISRIVFVKDFANSLEDYIELPEWPLEGSQ